MRYFGALILLFTLAASFGDSQQTQPEDVHEEMEVSLVDVFLTALDSRGAFVTDLKPEDLVLLEDGVPQSITHFSLSSEYSQDPIHVVILIDTSVSMNERYKERSKMDMARDGALLLLSQLKENDTMMLMTFSNSPAEAIPQTRDRTIMENAIRELKTDYGRTALVDALYLTSVKLENAWGRKVLFVCSDGQDNASERKAEKVLEEFKGSPDTMVMTLGTTSFESGAKWFGERQEIEKGEQLLQSLADATGGYAFFPKNMKDLGKVMDQLQRVISSQYSLAYHSTNRNMDGGWRGIEITTKRRGIKLRYRTGYFAK